MGPVAISSKLSRQVFHLVGQHPILRQKVPFIRVGFKGNGQKRHVRFLRCQAIFEPVTALASSDNILPFIRTASRGRHDMVASELASWKLIPAVETPVIVTPKKRSVT